MKNLTRALLSLTLVAFAAATFTGCTKTTEVVVVKKPVHVAKKKHHTPTPEEFRVVNSYDH
jgi:hypothetical protein